MLKKVDVRTLCAVETRAHLQMPNADAAKYCKTEAISGDYFTTLNALLSVPSFTPASVGIRVLLLPCIVKARERRRPRGGGTSDCPCWQAD